MLPTANTTAISMNAPRWPSAATSQALSNWLVTMVMLKAVAISCAWSSPIPNAPMTSGVATLTMVLDMTIVNDAVMPAIITRTR